MNTAPTLATATPVTPVTGITYWEAMRHCACIGSLSSLREMIQELDDQSALTNEFSEFASYCGRASEFEERFGPDCLLNLSHPSVEILIENVITPTELLAIRRRQETIAANPQNAERAEALKAEGRLLV